MMNHTFKIITNNCYQSNNTVKNHIKAISVSIPDYQEVHNHICTMDVTYNDRSIKSLIARVIYNNLTNDWIVDAKALVVNVIDTLDDGSDFEHVNHHSIPELNERIRIAHRAYHLHQQAS